MKQISGYIVLTVAVFDRSPPDNDLAVHDEIAKMAEIILSFEKDDLLPKVTLFIIL